MSFLSQIFNNNDYISRIQFSNYPDIEKLDSNEMLKYERLLKMFNDLLTNFNLYYKNDYKKDAQSPEGCNSNCRFLVLASGMNNKPTLTFTEEEYIALARQKYNELKALKDKPTFYDYEKSFEEIWLDLGRQVLEKSLSQVPTDRRKKKA